MEVKQEGLKMSVCSDFVEHIWKPGSCKNCFCPRSFHQLQAPSLDQQGGSEALQDLNGIGAKVENTPWADDSLISLSYSKPTIAVKPTMITSDATGVRADGNLNTDASQVMINKGCGVFYKVASVVKFVTAWEQSLYLLWQDLAEMDSFKQGDMQQSAGPKNLLLSKMGDSSDIYDASEQDVFGLKANRRAQIPLGMKRSYLLHFDPLILQSS